VTERKRMTLPGLFAKVAEGTPITWLTCYDYPTAYLQDEAGIDMILVGDSLGMTCSAPAASDHGGHGAPHRRRSKGASTLSLGDMPYMSYQPSVETAIRNAGRFMAEAGCDAVKLEGGAEMAWMAGIARRHSGDQAPRPDAADVSALGGFRLRGRPPPGQKIVDDAAALGPARSTPLELVPDRVCELITARARTAS
jgi:3-methyl-2-oxobutanoate hydroxymethyltransferase